MDSIIRIAGLITAIIGVPTAILVLVINFKKVFKAKKNGDKPPSSNDKSESGSTNVKKQSAEYLRAKKRVELGEEEYKNGNIEKALKYYEEAARRYRNLGAHLELLNILIYMNILHNILAKQYGQKAISHDLEAKALLSQEANNLAPKILKDLGADAARKGNYEVARKHYGDAESLFREREEYENLAEVLLLRGIMEGKQELGGREAAEEYFEFSMREYDNLNDKEGKARVFQSMGDLYRGLNDYALAIKFYENAWDLHQNTTDERRKHFIRGLLCLTYALAGQRDKAREWKQKIESIQAKMPEDSHARVYVQGCLDKAEELGLL